MLGSSRPAGQPRDSGTIPVPVGKGWLISGSSFPAGDSHHHPSLLHPCAHFTDEATPALMEISLAVEHPRGSLKPPSIIPQGLLRAFLLGEAGSLSRSLLAVCCGLLPELVWASPTPGSHEEDPILVFSI